jgi:transcriptional regulator with XRE-family HTH domain
MDPEERKEPMTKRGKASIATERRVFEQELLFGEARTTVVAALRSLRLTQRALAARLGVTEGRVSQVLSGRENITLRTLADVGWALGLRFELNPVALPNRSNTPAEDDPQLPQWLGRLKEQPRIRFADPHSGPPGPTPSRIHRNPLVLVGTSGETRSVADAA